MDITKDYKIKFINKRKDQLKIIGFKEKNNKLMTINFKAPTGEYINIDVDFSKKFYGEINWGLLNKYVGERTSSNLYKDEFVDQLYWVIKIIKTGYNPNNIRIEQGYTVGHKEGRMDIAILDHNNNYFAVLDVKTHKAYPNAVSEISHVQGQIPSYFRVDDTHIQYIGTITAHFLNNKILDDEFIVSTKNWDKNGGLDEVSKKIQKSGRILKSISLFGHGIAPYRSGAKILYINNLIPLGDSDNLSSKILNDFKNLIRRCGISNTTNAYNKILNLLIAKIEDEHKSNVKPSRQLHFINNNNQTDDAFMNNLNSLYEDGMSRLIGINNIGDNTDIKRLKIILAHIHGLTTEDSYNILNTARRIRNKSDSNFLFRDVYNNATYKDNVSIVRQVVDILYKYQFMHPKKSEFLGDFFENILDNGFKQNSGQYFTPIPIARYIMQSLPLKSQLYKDLRNDFIPNMIDFAVGSGHFLIEYMKSIQHYIDSIDLNKLSPLVSRKVKFYRGAYKDNESKFQWANQCVYGIDIDYRLVKTAKINTYLNGDGKAHILCTNGLNKFSSPDFTGLLKSNSNTNNHFDFLISNPPYSVKNFKKNLRDPDQYFQLSKFLKASSNKIELLFLERATQLVKTGGYLAIILPSTIFTSPNKLYIKARQLLIKHFSIRSITILPRNTFMATGTQTVLLLAKKIDHINFDKQKDDIYHILLDPNKNLNNYSNIFKPYIQDLFNGHINLTNYRKFILHPSIFIKESKYNSIMQKIIHLYNNYVHNGTDSWANHILLQESERIATFNNCNHNVVIISAPSNKVDDQRKLLGYKFSKRRGHEGLRTIRKHHSIDDLTMLYRGPHNTDDNIQYISDINYDNLMNKSFNIPSNLSGYVKKEPLYKIMGFRTIYDPSEKVDPFNTIKKNQTEYLGYKPNSNGQLLFLKDVADLDDGHGSISKDNHRPGNIPVIGGGINPKFKSAAMNRTGNVITVSKSGANAGYINYYSNPIYACSDCFTIKATKNSVYSTKELFHLLKMKQNAIYQAAAGSDQKHIYIKDLEYFQLPYKN